MNRWGRSAAWIFLGLLLAASAGQSGPVSGPIGGDLALPAGSPGERSNKMTFEANQRAAVILRGDHKPPATIGIEVYDENKRLVAKHVGKDFAAVVWYPPVRATYTIRFTNDQGVHNECGVVIK